MILDLQVHNIPYSRIACLIALKRYDECLEMIKEQLQVDDSNADLYVFRGQLNILFGSVRFP